jgi:DNA invertase Pin-like site-specific DNA recombinase
MGSPFGIFQGVIMSVIGYVSVSTEEQDVKSQREEILAYANNHGLRVDHFGDLGVSGRRGMKAKNSTKLPRGPKAGDMAIVSQLSCLGRSVRDVISVMIHLIRGGNRFVAIRENLDIGGAQGIQAEAILTILPLLLLVEKELISHRTKKALSAKRDQGVILGRPKGRMGKSKLDSRKSEIVDLLKDHASLSFIARRFRVSLPTVINFVRSRGLRESAEKARETV